MKKTNHKSGFSLVEIMVASLLLAVLALGGAAVMYQTGGNIQIQGNKRIAIELANEVLEREKAKAYLDITTPSEDAGSKVVDGIQHGITIARTNYPGASIADEYKHIVVTVTYRGNETVTLDTMVSVAN